MYSRAVTPFPVRLAHFRRGTAYAPEDLTNPRQPKTPSRRELPISIGEDGNSLPMMQKRHASQTGTKRGKVYGNLQRTDL